MRRWMLGCLLAIVCVLANGVYYLYTQEITPIRIMDFGYGGSRCRALESAIETYNIEHTTHGSYCLELDSYIDSSWDWNAYLNKFFYKNERGEVDLVIVSSDYLSKLALQGGLVCLDDEFLSSDLLQAYYTPLLPSLQYEDHFWGYLVETDVRMVFVSRNALRNMGYSETEMNALPAQVLNGWFTMNDLLTFGSESVRRGLTPYGIIYRPNTGLFFYLMAQSYDALTIDEAGNIQYNRENLIRMLDFFRQNTLASPPPTTADEIYEAFYNEQAAVIMGSCWSLGDLNTIYGPGSVAHIEQAYVPLLFPATKFGKSPSTMSNVMLIGIASNSPHQQVLRELLGRAYSDWNANALHVSQTYHMPISAASARSVYVQQNDFLRKNLYMLDYTSLAPNTPYLEQVYTALFHAASSVGTAEDSPELVADMLIADLKSIPAD